MALTSVAAEDSGLGRRCLLQIKHNEMVCYRDKQIWALTLKNNKHYVL